MKKTFSKLALMALGFLATERAVAAPFVCFTDSQRAVQVRQQTAALLENPSTEYFDQLLFTSQTELAALSCKAQSRLKIGMKAVGLSIQAGSLYLACTGVGAPVSLYLQGAGLIVGALDLIVGDLPCDDEDSEANIRRLTKMAVCDELAKNGVTCSL